MSKVNKYHSMEELPLFERKLVNTYRDEKAGTNKDWLQTDILIHITPQQNHFNQRPITVLKTIRLSGEN